MSELAAQQPSVTSATRRNITVRALRQLTMRASTALLGIAIAAALTRALGPQDFGNFSLALTLTATGTAVADMGMTQVAVRDMVDRPHQRAQLAAGLVVGRTALGLVAMGVGIPVAFIVSDDGETRIAAAIILSTLLLTGVGSIVSVAQARLRPDLATAISVLQSLLWLPIVISLGLTSAPLWAFATGYTATIVIQTSLAWRLCGRLTDIDWKPAAKVARSIARTGLPLGVAGLCVTAYYRLSGIILFQTHGPIESGQFAAAYRFLDTLQMVPATFAAVLVPLVVARKREGKDGRVAYSMSVRLMLAICIPIIMLSIALAEPLVTLIYGSAFAPTAPVLQTLMPAFAFIAYGYIATSVLIATGDYLGYSVTVALCAAVNIAVNLVVIPRWGATGAAWTTTGTEVLVVTLLTMRLHHKHQYPFPAFHVGAAFLFGVASYAAYGATSNLINDAAGVASMLLVFGACAVASRLVSVSDIKLMLSSRHEVHA